MGVVVVNVICLKIIGIILLKCIDAIGSTQLQQLPKASLEISGVPSADPG